MDKNHVIAAIAEVLTEIQSDSGREPTAVTNDTCPIGDLDGFDSLNGIEATVELSARLGVDLPVINAFVNDNGTKALTVAEIANTICEAGASERTKP